MRWLLRFYPRVWRDRYEEEMLALIEEHKVTSATVIDLLIGALDANLNYNEFTEGVTYMINRIRSGIVMAFCAFILFGVGWSLLARLSDPMPNFQAVNQFHPEFSILDEAVFIAGCLSFLAFLIGGFPVLFIAVKRAFKNKKQNVLIPFWTALSCLLLFVVSTAIVIWHLNAHVLIGYLIFSALLLVTGTASTSLVVTRTEFQLSELKFVFIPEVVILFCMVISVLLSTILFITLITYAPQLLHTQDVSSQMFITGIMFMALAAIFTFMGLKRGTIKGFDQITQE
jgi:hypothetical protein